MELERVYSTLIFWLPIILHSTVMCIGTEIITNSTILEDQIYSKDVEHTWSSWSKWSPCSRTCGGGVAVQERQCLPREISRSRTTIPAGTLAPPVISVRITRQAPKDECIGEAKRYHECNTAPCTRGVSDTRAQQCAAYDRRPFRGRFYTWVPYVDGNYPCTLNCRPLGQLFYATLALVADGTPCTKPGFRAMCVQGVCKVVGREGVLASSVAHDLRCGRQLVSGLFSRPRLPIGYTYIATVPRGACRLNISVVLPSENYIALKLVNGSYIINGEFAVSASGSYEAAGARFIYRRITSQDNVYAHGPLLQPIDIMVLYTQPNPSIKYEYLTDGGELKGGDKITETPKHARRHHNFDSLSSVSPITSTKAVKHSYQGDMLSAEDDTEIKGRENIIGSRKFVWKVLSFNQCSRTCGGGIQLGKYRCVEDTYKGAEREVSSVHCNGSPPVNKRRRCGFAPCPPKWRSTSWSKCPHCGPANRTRLVGCVQDHSRGIIKVSDVKCPPYKPPTIEPCNIPDCGNNNFNEDIQTTPEPRTKIRDREPEIEAFHAGPIYTVSVNGTENEVGPEYSFGTVGGWLHTDWSECVGWCVGGGIETREVKCADPAGCEPKRAPDTSRSCTPSISCDKHDGQWFTGEWSPCSSPCKGKQIRGVLCIGNSGRHLRDSACKGLRPDHEQTCGTECSPTWYTSDWSQCVGGCLNVTGLQRRTVWCARGDGPASPDADCTTPKPIAQKPCTSTTQCSTKTTTTTTTDAPEILPNVEIESQVKTENEIPEENKTKDCKDKLGNCQLAVQARLCHYNYYSENCCHSCQRR